MASENNTNIVLNNYSDDSKIKQYISDVLMPRVFHDIPLNTLNSGFFSVVSEYMSQVIENLAFTGSFYHNESFITKAVLADSIYSEAAIFNIGYAYAKPSCCNFMLELKISDLKKVSTANNDLKNVQEFILDKNTKINLQNGSIYSLDYDILIQYTKNANDDPTAWNIQYTNMDEQNSVAVNKKPYILYRVSDTWLHIFVKMSEIERQTHTVINNMTNGIPNDDFVITCTNNIAGFDVKYVDGNGNEQYLDKDHVLPLHADVKDQLPYVHYIMDNPQTIRFKFQMNGNRYFVPQLNSRFEIVIYTCHGDAANFSSFNSNESVSVVTSTNKYPNNGNVQKTAFVMSGSEEGTNIGTIETTRRETIEAYNTANVISSDHDIYEWFKTFFFKKMLYPFFFKRRDDPWGRIWSGFIALTDPQGDVYRTNTLLAKIPYNILYNNNENIISSNEIIIPPGWSWIYTDKESNRYTVTPLVKSNDQVEPADTTVNVGGDFIFANPFGIRIQKSPFAIAYFNPWIDETTTASHVEGVFTYQNTIIQDSDESVIYHATPSGIHIKRTYQDDFYHIQALIIPNQVSPNMGAVFVNQLRNGLPVPFLPEIMWNYFIKPADLFAKQIPFLAQTASDQYIVYDPKLTYICAKDKIRTNDGWILRDIFIDDHGSGNRFDINIKPYFDDAFGTDDLWGDDGICEAIPVTGDTTVEVIPTIHDSDPIVFNRIEAQNYYDLRIADNVAQGYIKKIATTSGVFETTLTKYGETTLYRIGQSYADTIYLKLYYDDGVVRECNIHNAANVYIPYTPHESSESSSITEFDLNNLTGGDIILYADMKPSQSEAAIDYYRIPFELVDKNTALFSLLSSSMSLQTNDMRVVLEAKLNGVATGHVEMQPVSANTDGSILFDTVMYPMNKMVDTANRIQIKSVNYGGGTWIPITDNSLVCVDGTTPELTMYIMFKSKDRNLITPIHDDNSFTGYRLQDRWNIDPIPFVEELKEMRSVVNFDEYHDYNEDIVEAYNTFRDYGIYHEDMGIQEPDPLDPAWNLHTMKKFAQDMILHRTTDITFNNFKFLAFYERSELTSSINQYKDKEYIPELETPYMNELLEFLNILFDSSSQPGDVDWDYAYQMFNAYLPNIDDIFKNTCINSDIEIQLVPFVQATLMSGDMFGSFVSSFTQIHKAIEPVIFQRLEGNNYLDCKLIATYGLPHSYVSDVDKAVEDAFWPDLDIQIEFDVKLWNPALSTNTLQELKQIIRSYFNRITTVHTPIDMISMNNNIYISQLIQQMEEHSNVAYLKFKGWYTNQKNIDNSHYMNADYQAIVQKWDTLEDMPTKELERYVPEMFVLSDANIILNII